SSCTPPLAGASFEHVTSILQQASKLEQESRYPHKGDLSFSKRLASNILSLALHTIGDSNVLLHIHIWLVFLVHVAKFEPAIRLLENEFPWEHLVSMLNRLVEKSDQDRFGCKDFAVPEKGCGRPLPEDYTL
ncbi:hypothetical protein L873DRAFT_1799841, partial [Choiromyces venosus 120613-1]